MKFKRLDIHNLHIAVYESEGTGTPVVFLHANSIGAAEFYWQMMSEEGQKYRFISIDMPGHGASDFSFQPDKHYNLAAISDIMSAAIGHLDFDQCILCGHGLGAHLAIRVAAKSDKVKALMLVGAAPLHSYQHLEEAYKVDEVFKLLAKGPLNEAEVSILAQLFVSSDDVAEIMFVDNIKNTDPNFRTWMHRSFANDQTNDFNILRTLKIPITLLNGDKDRIVRKEYLESNAIKELLWRNKVQYISEAGNTPIWEKYKVFNYFLEQFILFCV